jgi:hypothetical protein
MKKVILACLAIAFIALLPVQATYAHVLGEEANNSTAALLHIMPDDDPVTGQATTIYFDLQGFEGKTIKQVSLTVIDDAGAIDTVPLTLQNTTASGPYVFNAAGTYQLQLKVEASDATHEIVFHQVVTNAQTKVDIYQYPWAIALLLVCSAGIALLVVLAIVNRKEIIADSVMKK